jgi:DNA repair protein RadC
MKDPSSMSRDELARELIATSALPTEEKPSGNRGRRRAADRDALVAHKLALARELLLRQLVDGMKAGPVLSSPAVVREWLQLYCANLGHEVFVVLLLDSQNKLIEARELFRGTLSQTSVYPREVVKYALARNAAAVMFAHNHPSGVAEPSRADELLTQSLKQGLALVDVRVLDHFVVAGTSTVSFSERGLL